MKKVVLISALFALFWGLNIPGEPTTSMAVSEAIQRVSVASDGSQTNGPSAEAAISADGRYVAFSSRASNLVPDDTNDMRDVFVYDRLTGGIERVSVATDGTQAQYPSYNPVEYVKDTGSYGPALSADGRFVAFASIANNLVSGDTNGTSDAFIHDRLSGQTTRVSMAWDGSQEDAGVGNGSISISADGSRIAFWSGSTNLVPGDTNNSADIFVYDRRSGKIVRASVSSDGSQAEGGYSSSLYPSISADGRYVAFGSHAGNLVPGDTRMCMGGTYNNCPDVFVHDLQTGETTRVSITTDGLDGNGGSGEFSVLSADGRFVTFLSSASNFVDNDTNLQEDIFVHDRLTRKMYRASVSSMGKQGETLPDVIPGTHATSVGLSSISADGQRVIFASNFLDLVGNLTPESCIQDGYGWYCQNIYLHDLANGQTSMLSVSPEGKAGNSYSGGNGGQYLSIAANGGTAAYVSLASNLVLSDTNNADDIFAQDISMPAPLLSADHRSGAPGSFFALNASNLPPTTTVTITVNGQALGTLVTDIAGKGNFLLSSDQVTPGYYFITASTGPFAFPTLMLQVDPGQPVHPKAGSGPVFNLPGNLAYSQLLHLPSLPKSLFTGFDGSLSNPVASYDSGMMLFNLSSSPTQVQLTFLNRDGSTALVTNVQLQGFASKIYYPLEDIGSRYQNVPFGFDGSVVIASDHPVSAMVNVVGSNRQENPLAFTASYNGISAAEDSAYLPLLMRRNYGFNTWFSVQNLGIEPTDITVAYNNGVTETVRMVQPGVAVKFDQEKDTRLQGGFVGSAVLSSSNQQPIAATVFEVGPTTLFAYSSFSTGTPRPFFPLVQENHYGYVTGIQIQNIGTSETTATITYTPAAGWPGTACQETRRIQAGKAANFALYAFTPFQDIDPQGLVETTCARGDTFVGSAEVTANSAGVDLVGTINQLTSTGNKGAAYESFNPAQATNTVVFPLVMDRNYGYFTGLNIANAGSVEIAAGQIVCTITGESSGGKFSKEYLSPALKPGASWKLVNLTGQEGEIAADFVGSAVCIGPESSRLVGSINGANITGATDTLTGYDGLNLAPGEILLEELRQISH